MHKENNFKCKDTSMVLGNSVDVDLCKICDPEIRADIVVNQVNSKRIWGQVVNCEGNPMANIQVKLVKVICENNKMYYEGIAHTITDCEGFYQFDICADDKSCYKILTSKSVAAGETIIDTMGGNCDPCGYSKPHYNPCQPQETKVVPPSSCNCHEGNNCGYHQDNSCNCGCNCSYDNYNQSKPYRKSNYALYNRI